MYPSQLRRILLEDHRWLREMLADADEVAHRVEQGDHELIGRLRERARSLRERFLGHLDFEEKQLDPALRDADDWGEQRSEILRREHAEQRERFAALLRRLRQPCGDPRPLARDVRSLVRDLLADMESEESSLLSDRVLRDDPVVVDAEPD
jgi:hemerythrin-like domain-containing protein